MHVVAQFQLTLRTAKQKEGTAIAREAGRLEARRHRRAAFPRRQKPFESFSPLRPGAGLTTGIAVAVAAPKRGTRW